MIVPIGYTVFEIVDDLDFVCGHCARRTGFLDAGLGQDTATGKVHLLCRECRNILKVGARVHGTTNPTSKDLKRELLSYLHMMRFEKMQHAYKETGALQRRGAQPTAQGVQSN